MPIQEESAGRALNTLGTAHLLTGLEYFGILLEELVEVKEESRLSRAVPRKGLGLELVWMVVHLYMSAL